MNLEQLSSTLAKLGESAAGIAGMIKEIEQELPALLDRVERSPLPGEFAEDLKNLAKQFSEVDQQFKKVAEDMARQHVILTERAATNR